MVPIMRPTTTTTTPIIVVRNEESFRRVVGIVSFLTSILGLGNAVASKENGLSLAEWLNHDLLHSDSSDSLIFTRT